MERQVKKRAPPVIVISDSEDDERVVVPPLRNGAQASSQKEGESSISKIANSQSVAKRPQPLLVPLPRKSIGLSHSSSHVGKEAVGLVKSHTASSTLTMTTSSAQRRGQVSSTSSLSATNTAHRVASSELWVDSSAPKSPMELAVHVAKVREVESWLSAAVAIHKDQAMKTRPAPPRLLVLIGPPGTGKSTTGEAFCFMPASVFVTSVTRLPFLTPDVVSSQSRS